MLRKIKSYFIPEMTHVTDDTANPVLASSSNSDLTPILPSSSDDVDITISSSNNVPVTTDDTTKLKKVAPSKMLLIGSMPCERQTAYIRNEAIEAMNRNEIGTVAFRYLQSRRGENMTFFEVAFYSSSLLYSCIRPLLYILNESDNQNDDPNDEYSISLQSYLIILYTIANILPNIVNTSRYKETKNACEQWLEQKLSQQAINEIKTIWYPYRGMYGNLQKLVTILNREHIPTDDIANKIWYKSR